MNVKQKSYVNLSWLVYVVIAVLGFFLVRLFFEELNIANVYDLEMNIYVYDALIIVYGFVSCGLVYNGGKLLFSLANGYEFVYFNLYFIGIEKHEGKLRFVSGLKYDLSSKVLMKPKSDDVKTTLPLLGGTIASIAALAITYLLIFLINTSATTKFFFLVSSMFYIFIVLLNLVPCRMDSLNDGFALFLLKEQDVKKVYLNNLRNSHAMMDQSLELIYCEVEVVDHPLVLEAQLYNYYYLLTHDEMDKANELAASLYPYYKNYILEEHMNAVFFAKAYSMCYNKQNEELKAFYSKLDSTNKNAFMEAKQLEVIKSALYIYTFIDEDREGYAKIINGIEKAKKKYKYPRFIPIQEKLIKEVIKEVQDNKPEWNA